MANTLDTRWYNIIILIMLTVFVGSETSFPGSLPAQKNGLLFFGASNGELGG